MTKKNIGAHIKSSVSVSKSKAKSKEKQAKTAKSSGKVPKIFLILLGVFVVILVAGLLVQNWGKIMPQDTKTVAIKENIINKESEISNATSNIDTAVNSINNILNGKNTNTNTGGN